MSQTILFNKHINWLNEAINFNNPELSSCYMHHYMGCVAVMNGKAIAYGKNSNRNYSNDGFLNNCHSCHAEIDVLRKIKKLYGLKGNPKHNKQYLL